MISAIHPQLVKKDEGGIRACVSEALKKRELAMKADDIPQGTQDKGGAEGRLWGTLPGLQAPRFTCWGLYCSKVSRIVKGVY